MRRRAFLAGMLAAAAPRPTWADVGTPAFLAAGKTDEGFVLHGLDAGGQSLFGVPLPARGHAAAAHPTRAEAVAFARRPGVFALVIDCATGEIRFRLAPPDGMQFNGHGSYSHDGSLLMTSEVIADTAEGRIGVWETAGYTRLTDWPSQGIGPHDIKLLPDGSLAVANGGIRTDPVDRTKLNIPDMRPNLSLLSTEGKLLDQVELADLHQNSIRHLALTGTGIAFAMQWEGDPMEPVPQLGLWGAGSPPRLCPPPDVDAFALQGYAGSIAAHDNRILITSPKAGAAMLFAADGRYVASHHRADLSGAARGPQGLVATDGSGTVWAVTDSEMTPLARHEVAWDNHLVALT